MVFSLKDNRPHGNKIFFKLTSLFVFSFLRISMGGSVGKSPRAGCSDMHVHVEAWISDDPEMNIWSLYYFLCNSLQSKSPRAETLERFYYFFLFIISFLFLRILLRALARCRFGRRFSFVFARSTQNSLDHWSCFSSLADQNDYETASNIGKVSSLGQVTQQSLAIGARSLSISFLSFVPPL